MEISILKTYNQNKNVLKKHRLTNPEGKTLEEIIYLEEKLNQGNNFPLAFREFLFIGGSFNALGFSNGLGDFIGLKDFYDKKLKKRNIFINRPFIIFDNFEGEICSFIYLDEGDDPQPWNCSVNLEYDDDDNGSIWKMPFSSFSNLIDQSADDALKGLSPF